MAEPRLCVGVRPHCSAVLVAKPLCRIWGLVAGLYLLVLCPTDNPPAHALAKLGKPLFVISVRRLLAIVIDGLCNPLWICGSALGSRFSPGTLQFLRKQGHWESQWIQEKVEGP